jgi:hypothetical protein
MAQFGREPDPFELEVAEFLPAFGFRSEAAKVEPDQASYLRPSQGLRKMGLLVKGRIAPLGDCEQNIARAFLFQKQLTSNSIALDSAALLEQNTSKRFDRARLGATISLTADGCDWSFASRKDDPSTQTSNSSIMDHPLRSLIRWKVRRKFPILRTRL